MDPSSFRERANADSVKKTIENFEYRECQNDDQIRSTYNVMKQLRPHLKDENEYIQTVKRLMQQEKYHLVGLYNKNDPNQCVGVAGYQPQERLFCGKFIYLADLAVDAHWHRCGLGSMLLRYVQQEADQIQAKGVILESGTQRKEAHQFYEASGYTVRSLSFRRFPSESQAAVDVG